MTLLWLSAGDFQFSVASDDNSEFWLSSDDSPSNSRLAAFVGKVWCYLCSFPCSRGKDPRVAVLGAALSPLCSFGNAGLFQLAPNPGQAWLGFQRRPLVPSWLKLPKTRRFNISPWIFLGLIPVRGSWWVLV